jgi:hypothetical protein
MRQSLTRHIYYIAQKHVVYKHNAASIRQRCIELSTQHIALTQLTTNPPACCLNRVERTGSLGVSCPVTTNPPCSTVCGYGSRALVTVNSVWCVKREANTINRVKGCHVSV